MKLNFKNKGSQPTNQAPNGESRKSHIPFRLNLLFFVVFGLFVALLIQLAYLQIANSDVFAAKIEWSQKNVVQGNAPRGMIYDAKGEILVGNQANQAIIYTKKEGMKAEDILKTSQQITSLIEIEPADLTERDKKDFWLADEKNLEATKELLTKKEAEDDKKVYSILVDKVTEDKIQFDEQTMKDATVYKIINGAYAMTPVFVKNKDVTPEEIALIGEHTTDIPGISTGMDWEREYPKGNFMRSILGIVSSEKMGLPEDESDKYLAQGYARNDRVGLSYLEKQYESVLKGTKSQSEVIINKETNELESEEKVYDGEKGKNLVLTIDMEFQKIIEDILRKNYGELEARGKTEHSEGIYAVVNNPRTGEINAMVGLERDKNTGELTDDTLGTINKVFTPGSVVKGATVMAGYNTGVISGNQTLVDEPIKLKGDAVKQSVFTPWTGVMPMSTVDALRDSSNVYMMKIVFLMMNEVYTPEMVLGDHSDVFNLLRSNLENFGLGGYTGIDLPGENSGLVPKDMYDANGNLKQGRMGNLLDLSYGNFDAYTPMQLAQYISTVANSGTKVAPRVVREIVENDPKGENVGFTDKIETKVMSQVGTPEQWSIIHEGMYQVINAGGSGAAMQGTKYTASGKTGTAESPIPDPNYPNDPEKVLELVNSSMVSYAPSDAPKVAVTLIIPHIKDEKDGMNTRISKEILDAYYDYFEK